MKISKYKNTLIIGLLIIFTGLFLRTVNLNSLPIFVDEAIYVRWSQVMKAEPTLRFLPMSDGKQPLFMWLTIPFFKIFNDPLIAGRFLSSLSGIGTILGIFILSVLLFKNKNVGLLSALIYAISPYGVFFERLALVDSLLAMLGIWTLIFSILLVKTRRLDAAMITGLFLGGALITKSPALFFIILLPFSFLFFERDKKQKEISFIYTGFLFLISLGIGLFIFNLLRLGPNFHLIFSRNLDYVYPYTRIFTKPTDPFISNIKEYLSWIAFFGPYPLFALLILGLLNIKKYFKQILLLSAWAFGSVIVQSEYSISFTARYVLFTFPYFVIIASSSIIVTKKYIKLIYAALIIFTSLSVYRNYLLITNPVVAGMPEGESSGYLEEWTAGWGIKQVAEKMLEIRDLNPEKEILIATEGYFGTLPDGLQVYLEKQPKITVIGIGLGINDIKPLEDAKSEGKLAFLVANSSRLNFEKGYEAKGLKVIYEIKKPNRPFGTHGYYQHGEYDNFYLFELTDDKINNDE